VSQTLKHWDPIWYICPSIDIIFGFLNFVFGSGLFAVNMQFGILRADTDSLPWRYIGPA